MIGTSFVFLLSLQASGETALAVKPDAPKTWAVEYPVMISPYIDDYRGCLNGGIRTIGDDVDFEVQHRSDIPRCSRVADVSMNEANAVLAKRNRDNQTTPADVVTVFETIRLIHVERGRDLDSQVRMRLAANPVYRDDVQGILEGQSDVSSQ